MRQMSKARRRLAAGAFLIVAGPVALGSVAYACQSLATLHANPLTAQAGTSVNVFGKNYSSASTSSAIEIHLDGRGGQVIASFPPASTIDGPVTIPLGTPAGTHTLVATQTQANGNPVSGTPGRATVEVTVASRTAADGQSTAPAAAGSTDSAAAPVAATPATPAAVSAAPARSSAAPSSAAPAQASAAPSASGVAAPAAPAANVAATPAGAEAAVAAPAVSAPDAAAAPSAPAAGPAEVNVGLLPASSESTSILPGLTLVAGLAMVLLGLVAFLKSGRNILGRSPLAG